MNDDELRELQERVDVMTTMTETQGWTMLVDAAIAAIEGRRLHVLRGNCASFEEYKADCSFTQGMDFLLALPQRMQASLDLELGERRDREAEELEEVM